MALKDLPIEKRRFYHSLIFPTFFIFLIWTLKLYETIDGKDLSVLGIFPRQFDGLIGIVFAPLIHQDFVHLINNTIPLYFLMIGIYYFFNLIAYKIFFISYFVTNILVWIIGRAAYHIGSSGLIYSFAFYLFFSGVISKNNNLLALSLLVTFLYGSMVWGLFPVIGHISWESHLSGALTGILLAFYYKPFIIQMYKVEIDELNSDDEDDDYNLNEEEMPKTNYDDQNEKNFNNS